MRNIALFGNATFRLTDRFWISGGLRWAHNDQTFRQVSSGAIVPPADRPGESSEDVWTFSVSPQYHFTDDTMLYARVATGYRPGGPNVVVPGLPATVDADTLINYELGLKTRLADPRSVARRRLVPDGLGRHPGPDPVRRHRRPRQWRNRAQPGDRGGPRPRTRAGSHARRERRLYRLRADRGRAGCRRPRRGSPAEHSEVQRLADRELRFPASATTPTRRSAAGCATSVTVSRRSKAMPLRSTFRTIRRST